MTTIIEQLALARRTVGAHDLVIRSGVASYLKVDGRPTAPLSTVASHEEVVAFCASFNIDAKALFAQGRTGRFAAEGPYGRVRVELAQDIRGASLRFRMLSDEPWPLARVGLPDIPLTALREAQRGLVIVTGVVGSAKSTIVDALIDGIYVPDGRDIIMFQDPVETLHRSHLVSQYNVGSAPLNLRSWEEGNEHQLRSNALVVVIGEVNNETTAIAALRAAESGALVFITLHSSRTTRAPGRLLALFGDGGQSLARVMIADALVGVLGPRLVRRSEVTDGEPGRVLATEWLPNDPDVRLSILNDDTKALSDYLQVPSMEGLRPLLIEDQLSDLADNEIISIEEAQRAANDRSLLFRRSSRRGSFV